MVQSIDVTSVDIRRGKLFPRDFQVTQTSKMPLQVEAGRRLILGLAYIRSQVCLFVLNFQGL